MSLAVANVRDAFASVGKRRVLADVVDSCVLETLLMLDVPHPGRSSSAKASSMTSRSLEQLQAMIGASRNAASNCVRCRVRQKRKRQERTGGGRFFSGAKTLPCQSGPSRDERAFRANLEGWHPNEFHKSPTQKRSPDLIFASLRKVELLILRRLELGR